jgi:hypothetical protein
MSKTLRQRIFEDTGYDMLSPISIARDQKLRALYEAYLKAKGTAEEVVAYEAFAKFVFEEYQ